MSVDLVGPGTQAGLLPAETCVAGRWIVLHTKSRQEKALARFLTASDRPFYLPLIERVTFIRGRKSISRVPLFPGYLFLRGQLEDAYASVATKRVCRFLEVADQAEFEAELSQIATALAVGARLELYPFAVIGRRCRVVKGPFMGVEGIILERKSQARLVLQIGVLGQGASLEIDADFLEPVE